MAGVMTGMAAHRGTLPVGGTFFVFSDYMRGAVRVAAISDVHVIYSWTHDSIGLGQDGPTHQPIEQLAAMRAMPNLRVIRPADANETAQAWRIAVDSDGPTALILSRQAIPVLAGTAEPAPRAWPAVPTCCPTRRGDPRVVLVGTGSEVHVCLDAADLLASAGSPPGWCRSPRGSCSPVRTRTTDARPSLRGPPPGRGSGLVVRLGALRGGDRVPSTTSGRRPRGR